MHDKYNILSYPYVEPSAAWTNIEKSTRMPIDADND
jgi:hypothetical protein